MPSSPPLPYPSGTRRFPQFSWLPSRRPRTTSNRPSSRTVFRIRKRLRRACRRTSGLSRFASVRRVADYLETPERSIRLYQFEAGIPRFMAAPDNLSLRFAARSWMDQTDAFVQRQIRSYHRHAAGLAHVHGDGVGTFSPSALFPLYEELNPRDDALVASQTFPSFLYGPV